MWADWLKLQEIARSGRRRKGGDGSIAVARVELGAHHSRAAMAVAPSATEAGTQSRHQPYIRRNPPIEFYFIKLCTGNRCCWVSLTVPNRHFESHLRRSQLREVECTTIVNDTGYWPPFVHRFQMLERGLLVDDVGSGGSDGFRIVLLWLALAFL